MEVCPVCGEDFLGWSTQKTLPHLKCHQDQENLWVICGERFTSQVEQYLHCKRVHIEQMEVVCEECGKKSKTKQALSKHKLNIHSKKEVCETCDSKFSYKGNLLRHKMTVHKENAKLLECTQCNKSFKRKDDLSRHINTCHEKNRVFTCETESCGKHFANKKFEN